MTSDGRSAPKPEPEPVSTSDARGERGDPLVSETRSRRLPWGARTWIAAGAVVVIVGFMLTWWLTSGSSTGPHTRRTSPAHPSPVVPTWAAKLSVSSSGRVLGLPVLYPTINAVVPPDVKWEGPGADDPDSANLSDQLNIWGDYSSSRARALRVEVIRYPSEDGAKTALSSDRSGCTGANKEPCADYVPPKRDVYLEVFEAEVGRAKTVADLGDGAFAAPVEQRKFKSPSAMERTETTYNIGGSVVECRFRNVVIRVDWRGADYPPGAAGKSPLMGENIPYGEARQYATTVARAVIARLSRGR